MNTKVPNTVQIVRHNRDFYDVYIDGKMVGKGSWGFVSTAFYFYKSEGMDVMIYDE
jgi:hypothetical protein